MSEPTEADLVPHPKIYESSRPLWDVLMSPNAALPLLEASSTGDDTALQRLLFQPHWTCIALENQHYIYSTHRGRDDGNRPDVRTVSAPPLSNLRRAVIIAAENGHAECLATLLAFAEEVAVKPSSVIDRWAVDKAISNGNLAVFEALISADPGVRNFHLHHGRLALDQAILRRKIDVVAVLLRLGADPNLYMHAGQSYSRSLLCLAVKGDGNYRIAMTELLLKYGVPVAGSGALHLAAELGLFDTMRLLMRYGADVNERLVEDGLLRYVDQAERALVSSWTPMHFAALKGRVEAIELLKGNGALSDVRDRNAPSHLPSLSSGHTERHLQNYLEARSPQHLPVVHRGQVAEYQHFCRLVGQTGCEVARCLVL